MSSRLPPHLALPRPHLLPILLGGGLALTLAVALPRLALADEPPFVDAPKLRPDELPPSPPSVPAKARDDLSGFPYATPQDKHYLRAAVEVFSVLIIGNVDYLQNTTARGGTLKNGDHRWDLRYDWPTFHDKLTGDYYKVDTNHFNTNYISHPFAGTNYYTAARSNHLGVGEALAYAAVGALTWEYFGELREEVSINDAIVTEVAGMGIGEPVMQLRSFFRRSEKNWRNDLLAVVVAPIGAINDFADGGALERSRNLDGNGFTTDVWHRFELFAGGGATWQGRATSASPRGAYADATFGLDTQLKNLPGWERGPDRTAFFDDGNVTSLRFDFTLSDGRMVDGRLETHLVPIGVYARRMGNDSRSFVGLSGSFEYGVHEFDRDGTRPIDLVAVVSPFGVVAEHEQRLGPLRLRSRMDLYAEFAGVTSYALDDYRFAHRRDDTNLQTVLRQEGYYHALGVTVAPELGVGWGPLDVFGRARLDTWQGIGGFDENQERIKREIPLADRRMSVTGGAAVTIPGTGLRVGALGRRQVRAGEVGEVRASRSEAQILGTVSVLF